MSFDKVYIGSIKKDLSWVLQDNLWRRNTEVDFGDWKTLVGAGQAPDGTERSKGTEGAHAGSQTAPTQEEGRSRRK